MSDRLVSSQHCWTLTAGAAATAVMMLASRASRSQVMPELQELAATAAAPRGSAAGEVFGYSVQLANGALFADFYSAAFHWLGVPPSWRTGAALGLGHGLLAGAVLAAVPAVHPRVPEEVPPPGAFMRHRGLGAAIMLVVLHGLYGAVVGRALAAATSRPLPA